MQNNARERRIFVCKRCGTNIDLRRRRADGSLQCPKCKVIYRPKPTQNQAPMRCQPPRRNRGFIGLWHSIPWERKIFKLPIWLWVVIVFLALVIPAPANEDNGVIVEEAPIVTSAPTQQVEPSETNDWETRYNNTKEDVLKYLDSVFAQYQYYLEPYLDYTTSSPDIYIVNTDIIVNGDDFASVKEALHHIEDQLVNSPYKFNFHISMMSENRSTICVVTFGEEHDGYTIIASGRVTTYGTIDEI